MKRAAAAGQAQALTAEGIRQQLVAAEAAGGAFESIPAAELEEPVEQLRQYHLSRHGMPLATDAQLGDSGQQQQRRRAHSDKAGCPVCVAEEQAADCGYCQAHCPSPTCARHGAERQLQQQWRNGYYYDASGRRSAWYNNQEMWLAFVAVVEAAAVTGQLQTATPDDIRQQLVAAGAAGGAFRYVPAVALEDSFDQLAMLHASFDDIPVDVDALSDFEAELAETGGS